MKTVGSTTTTAICRAKTPEQNILAATGAAKKAGLTTMDDGPRYAPKNNVFTDSFAPLPREQITWVSIPLQRNRAWQCGFTATVYKPKTLTEFLMTEHEIMEHFICENCHMK